MAQGEKNKLPDNNPNTKSKTANINNTEHVYRVKNKLAQC